MTRNKFSTILALGLIVFLLCPLWTKAERDDTSEGKVRPVLQASDDAPMRNSGTPGLTFSIKAFGGLGHLIGQNDVNKDLDGWNQLLRDAASLYDYGVSGEISPLGYGPSFGGELVFSFNPHLSIGLGAGYFWFTKKSTTTLTVDADQTHITLEPKISVIPLTLSLYYGLPIGNFLKIVVGVGAGYYLSQFSNSNIQGSGDEELTLLYDTNMNTIGFHGSLDFELNISRSLAFLIGASGRFANLKDISGTETLSYTNPTYNESDTSDDLILWYVEEEIFDGKYYASLYPDNVKPEGEWYRVSRRAEISLSSISMRAGIIIRFGQKNR